MNPPLPPGFDCDTINAEALLGRLSVKGTRLGLPDGMSYRYLVLPHRSVPGHVAARSAQNRRPGRSGATVIGPAAAQGARAFELAAMRRGGPAVWRAELWGADAGATGERQRWPGPRHLGPHAGGSRPRRIAWRQTWSSATLTPAKVAPRFDGVTAPLDWIHRRDGATDIYFVANLSNRPVSARAVFRAAGQRPELWDAGDWPDSSACRSPRWKKGAPLCRSSSSPSRASSSCSAKRRPRRNVKRRGTSRDAGAFNELAGPWEVSFDPQLGRPGKRGV